MNVQKIEPPREFTVGFGPPVVMRDCARIDLQPDEQVTFRTASGKEYDVARKEWGFYATPSLNSRLVNFGLRPVLVKNRVQRYFVLLVEKERETAFAHYVAEEGLLVCGWLDDPDTLTRIDQALQVA